MGAAAMTERTKRLSRRNFLLTVGAGGAATAAAIVAKNPASPKPSQSGKGKRATRGYHAHRARQQLLPHHQGLEEERAMLLTRKATGQAAPQSRLARGLSSALAKTIDRRAFLKRSGITVGAGAVAAPAAVQHDRRGRGEGRRPTGKIEVKRTVCTHCSVGCAIDAVVQNGVWVRQEPVFDSPINLGAHCAKGASVREHGITHDSHRLKYPMKLEGGKWKRLSWDQAYDEISKKMLEIRQGERARRAVRGRLLEAQQRAGRRCCASGCASGAPTTPTTRRASATRTTVAGVAQTWGYGAMTNSYNDELNSKSLLFLGSNAAEAHPVSMLHTLHAKENGCKVIVADPRFTRTAAKADKYVRFRSGTDVPLLFGMLHHVFKNGWEDKEYIRDRVYGMDEVKKEVMAKWTPQQGRPRPPACPSEEIVRRSPRSLAENRPGFIIWAMGQTQHNNANGVRARVEHPDARARQRRALGRRLQHLPRPRQRAGRDRRRPEPRHAAGLLPGRGARLVGALGAGLERRPRLAEEAVRLRGDDGQARHDGVALDRRRAREERRHRPGPEPAHDLLLGPRAELADARPRRCSRR